VIAGHIYTGFPLILILSIDVRLGFHPKNSKNEGYFFCEKNPLLFPRDEDLRGINGCVPLDFIVDES